MSESISKENSTKAILDFYKALMAGYPTVYRSGAEQLAEVTCRAWHRDFLKVYGIEALKWVVQNHLGRGIFEGVPPRPHHVAMLYEQRENDFFRKALRLDELLHAHYMSLYLKDPGSRLQRAGEVSQVLEDVNATPTDLHLMMSRLRRSADWRAYPPSVYDVQSLIHRNRAGIASYDEEFSNYLRGINTPCVKYICATIGRDNLRSMGVETLARIFKRIYYTLDESAWKDIRHYQNDTPSDIDTEKDDVSSENTLAIFNFQSKGSTQ